MAQAPTPQNIVIGGAAGAVPPLVGWAAVTGALDRTALYLFAIVFFWTPPHFWALSLLMKDEYARSACRCCRSSAASARRAARSCSTRVLLYAVTQLPFCAGGFGAIYLVAVAACSARVHRRRGACCSAAPTAAARCALYLFSLAYLALLFGAMVARRQAVDSDPPPMDRNLARKNIRTGLIAAAVVLLHVRHDVRRRRDLHRLMPSALDRDAPPAGEEIHLPGPSLHADPATRSASRWRWSA